MTIFRVRDRLDVYAPRQAVEELARKLGFPRQARQELAIVVSELCSNIVKYGIRGSIEIESLSDPTNGLAILLSASDEGPEFSDFWMALQDGCDDRGPIDPGKLLKRDGLGIGLGAIIRLTDTLQLEQGKQGKRIRVVRYQKPPSKLPRWSKLPKKS
jgi:anti-sigma regulatory factor (Ser/Thr protein kinase)